VKDLTMDYSRPDAGETLKDIKTKGSGMKTHKNFERKENFKVDDILAKVAAVKCSSAVNRTLSIFTGITKVGQLGMGMGTGVKPMGMNPLGKMAAPKPIKPLAGGNANMKKLRATGKSIPSGVSSTESFTAGKG